MNSMEKMEMTKKGSELEDERKWSNLNNRGWEEEGQWNEGFGVMKLLWILLSATGDGPRSLITHWDMHRNVH
jgi:hypothetical protein